MMQESIASQEPAEKVVRDIRRRTRKQYSVEEKIRTPQLGYGRSGAAVPFQATRRVRDRPGASHRTGTDAGAPARAVATASAHADLTAQTLAHRTMHGRRRCAAGNGCTARRCARGNG